MLFSSNYKINLSLSILSRRDDGFSEIETVMYPMVQSGLCDIVELIEADTFEFSSSGIKVDCPDDKNLCVKAYRLISERYGITGGKLHLHKRIPFGAGLGAGSANAVTVLKLYNTVYQLGITDDEMEKLAAELGSDTALFVREEPVVARGRGELLTPVELDLVGYYILLVKPDVGVSTAEAYRGVTPKIPEMMPCDAIKYPISEWKEVLSNDFEHSIFESLPVLKEIKEAMYAHGAIFSAMSGSGSTIFGIFEKKPTLTFDHFTHLVHF